MTNTGMSDADQPTLAEAAADLWGDDIPAHVLRQLGCTECDECDRLPCVCRENDADGERVLRVRIPGLYIGWCCGKPLAECVCQAAQKAVA